MTLPNQTPRSTCTLGYYPGCALHGTSKEYDISVRAVAAELGQELREIEDWNCCGASAGHSTNRKLAACLSLRNLALARQQNLKTVLTPCPLCSKQLLSAAAEVAADPQVRAEAEQTIEMPFGGGVRTINYIQYCTDSLDAITSRIGEGLRGLKAACYYGCLLTRPPKVVQFDDAEHPTSMENVVRALKGEPVEFSCKTDCCGGGFTQSHPEAVLRLSRKILENAKAAGAEVIAVACPMCQVNLDMRQAAIEKRYGISLGLPIVYLSQLAGLALGIDRKKLGLGLHFVSMPERGA
ncbi:MAG TPA: CoB--CoM heterodisulfide reductase iron-sulfur subunit B family protein [Planctomycetota bacterium]|nr:CoB--CoM heterodisulfide reductase iron-sulfur subunit B family protein [Planctomycetota bacterium]